MLRGPGLLACRARPASSQLALLRAAGLSGLPVCLSLCLPVWLSLLLSLSGCQRADESPRHGHDPAPAAPAGNAPSALARVASIHGGAGPFAVAGYRIGARALRELGLPEGSFDLDIQHESPAEVQWSCIADGVQASTGASPGKLNLRLREVPRDALQTVATRKSTGQRLSFRLTDTFARRFADVPRERLGSAGEEVLRLRDEEIFSVAVLPAASR